MTAERRIAAVLADHVRGAGKYTWMDCKCLEHIDCTCGWVTEYCDRLRGRGEHRVHVASEIVDELDRGRMFTELYAKISTELRNGPDSSDDPR